MMIIAVFLAAYIDWRPSEILFTLSDGAFVIGGALLIAARRMPTSPFGALTPFWYLAVCLMLFGLFVGSLFHDDPARWLIVAIQYVFSFIFLPLLLMGQSTDRIHFLCKAQLASIVCMEAFGSAIYFAYDGSYLETQKFGHEFITGGGRLTAFLADANWNAAVIAMTLPFAYYLRIRRLIGAVAFYVAVAILLLGLFLSASVTGLISAAVATVLFVLIGRVRLSPRAIVAGIAAIAVLFVVEFDSPRAFQNRIAPAIESGDLEQAGTFMQRWDLIREGWEIANDTVIVGMGADQFRLRAEGGDPVHNLLLLLWAEGGIVALLGWLLLSAILLVGAIGAYARDQLATTFALAVLAAFLICSNAAPHMYARMWIVPLLLAMAPAFALAKHWIPGRSFETQRASRLPLPPSSK